MWNRCRILETARLRLRPLTVADVDDLHRLFTQPGVRRYLRDDEVVPRERAAVLVDASVASFEAHGYGLWAVSLQNDDALIGFCGFWPFHEPPRLELLYGIAPGHWGAGWRPKPRPP